MPLNTTQSIETERIKEPGIHVFVAQIDCVVLPCGGRGAPIETERTRVPGIHVFVAQIDCVVLPRGGKGRTERG